jgi:hypothetical protein
MKPRRTALRALPAPVVKSLRHTYRSNAVTRRLGGVGTPSATAQKLVNAIIEWPETQDHCGKALMEVKKQGFLDTTEENLLT